MPWTIILEDENGKSLEICSHTLDYNEFTLDDIQELKLFKYLIPWGDTTFNEMQIPDLVADMEKIKTSSPQHDAINKIIELANKCPQTSHSYLKFYGD